MFARRVSISATTTGLRDARRQFGNGLEFLGRRLDRSMMAIVGRSFKGAGEFRALRVQFL